MLKSPGLAGTPSTVHGRAGLGHEEGVTGGPLPLPLPLEARHHLNE